MNDNKMSFIYVLNNVENCSSGIKNVEFFTNKETATNFLEKYTENLNEGRNILDPFYNHKVNENEYNNRYNKYIITKYTLNPEI